MSRSWLRSFHSEESQQNKDGVLGRDAKAVCVTGGKGGVGKTSVALKLSLELTRYGKKVLLVDCDHNLSNTAIKLGLPLNDNFLKLLKGELVFDQALYKQGDFHLLSGCNGNLDLFEGDHNFRDYFSEIINEQKRKYDYIILDSPAGVTEQTVFFASYCDERVIVLNPDQSSITDAYSLIKIIKNKFGIRDNLLIVNKIQDRLQFDRVIKTVSETAENYLNVRSHILGGIAFQSTEHENFDRQFLSGKKNLLNKNFIMILDKFLDKMGGRGRKEESFLPYRSRELLQGRFR